MGIGTTKGAAPITTESMHDDGVSDLQEIFSYTALSGSDSDDYDMLVCDVEN